MIALVLSPLLLMQLQVGVPQVDDLSAEATCLIEANDVIEIAPGTSGIIAALHVARGGAVAKGEVLATLRADIDAAALKLSEARAANASAIKAAEARVGFETRRRDRASELSQRNVMSETALDEAETDLATAQMNLLEARKSQEIARIEVIRQQAIIAEKTIRSPVDGVVVEVEASEGEFGNEGEVLMTIAEINPLKVQAFLPIRFYGDLKVGDRATVRPAGLQLGPLTAEVTAVDKVLDAASGTFGVILRLPNAEGAIPAGLKCEISFVQP